MEPFREPHASGCDHRGRRQWLAAAPVEHPHCLGGAAHRWQELHTGLSVAGLPLSSPLASPVGLALAPRLGWRPLLKASTLRLCLIGVGPAATGLTTQRTFPQGSFPTSWSRLTALTALELTGASNFVGSLPDAWFNSTPYMQSLQVGTSCEARMASVLTPLCAASRRCHAVHAQ